MPPRDFAMVFVFTVDVPVGRAVEVVAVEVAVVPVVVVGDPSFIHKSFSERLDDWEAQTTDRNTLEKEWVLHYANRPCGACLR